MAQAGFWRVVTPCCVYNHVQVLYMVNIQVSMDEKTLRQVDRASKPLGLKRSEIERQALRQWLQRQAVEQFEQQWISALKNQPHDDQAAEDWLGAEAWGKK